MDIEFKIQSLTILYIKNFIYPVSRREKIGTNLWLPISIKIDLIHANILNLEIAIGSRVLFFHLSKKFRFEQKTVFIRGCEEFDFAGVVIFSFNFLSLGEGERGR